MRRMGAMVVMALLSFLFGCGTSDDPYVSQAEFEENLARQTAMTPETLRRLREHGVKDDTHLELEYFFYANSAEKASALARILEGMGYSAEYGMSPHDKKIYVITGWTDKMPMDEATVVSWARQMCQIGYEKDCEFDGWGTYPDQQ